MKTRRTFSKEFKQEALRLAEETGNQSQTARDLGIHNSLIRKWKAQFEKEGERAFPGQGKPRDEELAHLQRENARLKEENAILKKAVGIFSKSPR